MDVVVFSAHDLSSSPADDGELRTTAVGCVHYIGKTRLWKKEENIDPCSICKNNSKPTTYWRLLGLISVEALNL